MNALFSDNLINRVELNHLAKEVKRKQLFETIRAMEKFNEMQTRIIKEQNINVSSYSKRKFY